MRVKLHFLAVLFTLLNAAIGADTGQAFIPPSPEDVKRWVDYDHNITLAGKAITRGDFTDWGKMVSVSEHNSRKETAISFVLAAYQAGTCMFNKVIPEYRKHAKEFSVSVSGSKEQVQPKVVKLPDGREIFVSIAGLGPGGGIEIAFGKSSNGKFDLLVARISDAQDGLREDERIKNPALPRRPLPDIFQEFDAHAAKSRNDLVELRRISELFDGGSTCFEFTRQSGTEIRIMLTDKEIAPEQTTEKATGYLLSITRDQRRVWIAAKSREEQEVLLLLKCFLKERCSGSMALKIKKLIEVIEDRSVPSVEHSFWHQ